MIWPILEGRNIFVRFLVQMKTSKFAFEINWPLHTSIITRVFDVIFSNISQNFEKIMVMKSMPNENWIWGDISNVIEYV